MEAFNDEGRCSAIPKIGGRHCSPTVGCSAPPVRRQGRLRSGADAQAVASFALPPRRAREKHTFLWAFDLLELDSADLRDLPLERRKGELETLLKRAPFGLALNDYVARDGPALFTQACAMGLEGVVSKRRSSPYRSGRSPLWLKAKDPESPAVRREALEDWGRKRR